MTGLEFALVALAGVLLGRFLPNRRKGPQPVEPICGCDHHHSFHDPQTGTCNASVPVARPRPDVYTPVSYDHRPCACRQYSGPQPMPEFFAPEVTA
jgi:hypothetical protein